MTAIATGGLASAVALLALTVDETDEAFANVYSTAVSLQNVFPQVPQRLLIFAASAAATIGALVIDLVQYETFLFLLGSFFVPLFGVLLGDWAMSAMHYGRREIFEAPSLRGELVASWLVGFALYQWLQPVGPRWWTSFMEHFHPSALHIGASLPSFALAFLLTVGSAVVTRRAGVPSRA